MRWQDSAAAETASRLEPETDADIEIRTAASRSRDDRKYESRHLVADL